MESQTIFSREIHPFKQAGGAIILLLIFQLLGLLFRGTAFFGEESVVFWEISMTILLAFMLFNSVMSIPYKNRGLYFRNSLISFVAIAVISGGLAQLLSGQSMDEAGSFKWLYFLFTFVYLVFISIVNAMRKIIEIAKKQDARLRGEL